MSGAGDAWRVPLCPATSCRGQPARPAEPVLCSREVLANRVCSVWGWRAPPFPPRAERLARPAEPTLSRAEPALCSREVFAGRVRVGEQGDTSRSAQGKEAMV